MFKKGMKRNSILVATVIVLVTIFLAYFLGNAAARLSSGDQSRDLEDVQEQLLLSQMRFVNPGDTIADLELSDLNGEKTLLSRHVSGKSMLVFFEPDCPACEKQMQVILKSATEPEELARFVFITSGNYTISYLKEFFGSGPHSLNLVVDPEDSLARRLRVRSFPFNLVVNEGLVVVKPQPRPLLESDVRDFLY